MASARLQISSVKIIAAANAYGLRRRGDREVKETGIIMSGDHPLKCLDGTKTMTRRTWGLERINEDPDLWRDPFFDEVTGYWNFWQVNTGEVLSAKCPYGQVGDRLWVRETWRVIGRSQTVTGRGQSDISWA